MKKALISPSENIELGDRVSQVETEPFEVALPLFWVECDDAVTTNMYYKDGLFIPIMPKPIPLVEQPLASGLTVV